MLIAYNIEYHIRNIMAEAKDNEIPVVVKESLREEATKAVQSMKAAGEIFGYISNPGLPGDVIFTIARHCPSSAKEAEVYQKN